VGTICLAGPRREAVRERPFTDDFLEWLVELTWLVGFVWRAVFFFFVVVAPA
jgi:hypothetical protein